MFPVPKAINLQDGQRAERKLLLTVVEWEEGEGTSGTQKREILGRRTEDSSVDFNHDLQQSTDILGINYADDNKTQPSQAFNPFLVLGGSDLAALLCDVMRRNGLSELSQFTVYLIYAFQGNSTNGYEAVKHVNCTITVDSIGGDANVNMPITVYFSNDLTTGSVDSLAKNFQFTPDV